MGSTWSQFFPPKPTLTEENLPPQHGKVFIVTGGTSGVGFEICSILCRGGGKVYMAGRSEAKATAAISKIMANASPAMGELCFLHIALDDLSTVKTAVNEFRSRESRLDVLFNNAGVSNPPRGSLGAQGHELQLATNCLGPYLFTQLLIPTLVATANKTTSGNTRVIWTSSIVTDVSSPKEGINLDHLSQTPGDQQLNYTTSKTGNWFLADGLAKQVGSDGIVSVTVNPGNLKSDLTRHLPRWVPLLAAPLLHHPIMGAYTNIWAAFTPELTVEQGGKYIVPWGRLHPNPRADILESLDSEGGTGVAAKFVEFCKNETKDFA